METTTIQPCPCGGGGLIKPMPELKPFTLLFDNSLAIADVRFGVVLDGLFDSAAFGNVKSPTSLNKNKLIITPFLMMLSHFPIAIHKIDVLVTKPTQLAQPLLFTVFNHNFKAKTIEIPLNNTIANTQVNSLMRSIELDYTLKPNNGFGMVVLKGEKVWLTLHPKQVTTS